MGRVSLERVVFAALCAVPLLAGIYAAALGGLADAHYYNARTILAAAAQAKRLPEVAGLASAGASLLAAHELEPANPLFVEQHARISEMRALGLARDDPAARGLLRGVAFGVVTGVTAIGIHSTMDLNLQIPANAFIFVVLLALGCASFHLGRVH